jgi:hypothetical protein
LIALRAPHKKIAGKKELQGEKNEKEEVGEMKPVKQPSQHILERAPWVHTRVQSAHIIKQASLMTSI